MNSYLLNYLNTNFKVSTETIVDHFAQEFGVNVKEENGYFLFKYDMIAVKWSNPLVFECRGCILKNFGSGWEFMCRPFDKFFNITEGHCPIFSNDEFGNKVSRMFLHEKRDGTCITCWFDGIDWRVSTLGTITPMKIGYNDFTFADLFKSAVGKSFFNLEKENTYIFELMSPYNRIVTDYGDSIIVSPLAVRNNKSGEYVIGYREFDIINLAPVHRISCYDLNIKNKEEMISFVENFQGNTSHFGKNPEGWVVYINDIPVAKVKNSRYLALHRFSDSDPLCSRNSLVDLFLAGGVDDVYSDLSPTMKAFCDSMGEFIRNNGADFIALCSSVKEKNPQTQKDYALLVKDTPFAAFMFKNKDFIMNNVVTIEDFTSFVRKDIPKTIYEQLKGLWVGPLLTQAVE